MIRLNYMKILLLKCFRMDICKNKLILNTHMKIDIIKECNGELFMNKNKLILSNKDNKNGYVYRFLDKDGNVLYVGRTTDLVKRFAQHSHLTDNVDKIEYIKCKSLADMAWKEIYYINFFYNKLMTNVSDVYYDEVTDLKLHDNWIEYNHEPGYFKETYEQTLHDYNNYILNYPIIPYLNYKDLIHIIEYDKINSIGDGKYDLSSKWFDIHKEDEFIKKAKNNIYNFFKNISNTQLEYNMWSTYDCYAYLLKGKGYTKGFTSLYDEENFPNKTSLVYFANPFFPVTVNKKDMEMTEDEYSLTLLLKFLFRSALREGKEITIYIPSKRMRNLLKQWIEENSA